MPFVAAIDQGTGSSRCIIFNERFQVVAWHQLTHRQITPKPGWLEHDPEEIFKTVCFCLLRTMEKAKMKNPDFHHVEAVGITNQRETAVAWDKTTGKPLYNAIVWNDTRTYELTKKYADAHCKGDTRYVNPVNGLPPSTYFSAFKFRWMLDNVKSVKAALEKGTLMLGTMESWLLYKFSNHTVHLTDAVNASRTFLMDLKTRQWSTELCEQCGIPISTLPKICSNSQKFCDILTNEYALATYFGKRKVPITGCIGDQQSALFGNLCLKAGEAKATYGSGCFVLVNVGDTPKISSHGLISTVAYQLGDKQCCYAMEGSIAGAGSVVTWMQNSLKLFRHPSEIDQLVRSVPDTAGVVVVPAFGGLLAPYWMPETRGAILGLTYRTTRGHIVRALMLSIAQQVTDVFSSFEDDLGVKLSTLKVDGGLTKNRSLMEIQADLLSVDVSVPHMTETTALGAAFCAGLAVGVWKSVDEIIDIARDELTHDVVKPSHYTAEEKKQLSENWRKAVEKSKWAKL